MNNIFYFIILIQNALSINYTNNGSSFSGVCQTGSKQSPINLNKSWEVCTKNLFIDLKFSNNNLDIRLDLSTNGLLKFIVPKSFILLYLRNIKGEINLYDSYEIYLHTPAEHQINGVNRSIELQIYLRNQENNNDIKALSFLYSNSIDNGDSFITFLTNMINNNTNSSVFSSIKAFNISRPIKFLSYEGSSTIPSCTENIEWFIIESQNNVLDSDINSLKDYLTQSTNLNYNNRIVQNLNSRIIYRGGVDCNDQFINFISFIILYAFIYYFIFKLL